MQDNRQDIQNGRFDPADVNRKPERFRDVLPT